MKSTGALLVLSACLLKLASSYTLIDSDDLSTNICTLYSGEGCVCGCDNTTSSFCTQGYNGYKGLFLDVVFTDLCVAFCASNGHMCKGDFCNECQDGNSTTNSS